MFFGGPRTHHQNPSESIAPMAAKRTREPETVDIEDLTEKCSPCKLVDVVELSRRRDVHFKMHELVEMLSKRRWEYPNPMNGKTVHRDLSKLRVLSLFSKDYSNFLRLYRSQPELFAGITLHFGISINTGLRTELEPGVQASFTDMLQQIRDLAELARNRGQSVPKSFTVHSNDPFVVLQEIETGKQVDNFNAKNFRELCDLLQLLSIRNIHFGWLDTSGGWKFIEKRLKKHGFRVVPFSIPEKLEFLSEPFKIAASFGIRMGTCAETVLLGQKIGGRRIRKSICLAFNKISTNCIRISGTSIKPKKHTRVGDKGCTCQAFSDLLTRPTYADPCKHGCLYCFSNPLGYPATK